MIPIELRPHTGGPAIIGNWNSRGLLYLMGQGGALQWSPEPTDGALPLAVAFWSRNGVAIAPVHPLCRLEEGQRRLRLGMDSFDVHMAISKWRLMLKTAAIIGAVIVTLACGWWLHSLVVSASPVVAQSQEELYVF